MEILMESNPPEELSSKVYAGFWRRVAAALIDLVVLGIAGFLMSMAYFPIRDRPECGLFLVVFIVGDLLESMFVFPVAPLLAYWGGDDSSVGGYMMPIHTVHFLLFTLAFPVLNWLYHAVLESSGRQATLGEMALKIKVTDLFDNRISFLRATARHFSKIVSTVILLIGFVMIAWTKKKQALHDKLAGCLVIRT